MASAERPVVLLVEDELHIARLVRLREALGSQLQAEAPLPVERQE